MTFVVLGPMVLLIGAAVLIGGYLLISRLMKKQDGDEKIRSGTLLGCAIGTVILTASILVPLFKILGMTIILLSIRYQWKSWLRHKTWMFRFIEFIGRWSMLDIYVIALLAVLINFGMLSAIHPAPAATYFAAVVLCTMFAAISFDSRILWDHCAPSGHPE